MDEISGLRATQVLSRWRAVIGNWIPPMGVQSDIPGDTGCVSLNPSLIIIMISEKSVQTVGFYGKHDIENDY